MKIQAAACLCLLMTMPSAMAADANPQRFPSTLPTASHLPNWSGFFVGAHFGWGNVSTEFHDLALGAETVAFDKGGLLGGGQVGFNFQTGPWVYGVEADGALSNLKKGQFGQFCGFPGGGLGGFGGGFGGGGFGGGGFGGGLGGGFGWGFQGGFGGGFGVFGGGFGGLGGFGGGLGGFGGGFNGCGFGGGFGCGGQQGARLQFTGTLSGRAGYAWGPWLLFFKAGMAVGQNRYVLNSPGLVAARPKATAPGWLIGAGLEYALSANWSAKVEYNYIDFGSQRVNFIGFGGLFPFEIRQHEHIAKVGVNYRFAL
jgi:opacity protein-like surface antigen